MATIPGTKQVKRFVKKLLIIPGTLQLMGTLHINTNQLAKFLAPPWPCADCNPNPGPAPTPPGAATHSCQYASLRRIR